MKGGSILIQELTTDVVDVWEVESINLGALNEIGVVRMKSLTRKNTIDGKPVEVAVPSNMVSALIEAKILKVYNQEN